MFHKINKRSNNSKEDECSELKTALGHKEHFLGEKDPQNRKLNGHLWKQYPASSSPVLPEQLKRREKYFKNWVEQIFLEL